MTKHLKDKPKIIFFDLDKTLVGKKHQVTIQDRVALKRLQKKHIYVVINTGRTYKRIKDIHKQISTNTYSDYVINLNGSIIRNVRTNNILRKVELSDEEIIDIFTFCKQKKAFLRFPDDPNFYGKKSFFYKILFNFSKYEFKNYDSVNFEEKGKTKLLLFTNFGKKSTRKLADNLKAKFPDLFVAVMRDRVIEISKSSKGEASKFLMNYLNIENKYSMAFGDSGNDISIFKEVNYSVAMKNSTRDLISYANFITKKQKKSGIYYALRSIISIEK